MQTEPKSIETQQKPQASKARLVAPRPQEDLGESFFCSHIKSENRYLIPETYLKNIIVKRRGSLFIPKKDALCLNKGSSYTLTFVATDVALKYAASSTSSVDATVSSLSAPASRAQIIASYNTFGFPTASNAADSLNKSLREFFAPLNGELAEFIWVEFSISGETLPKEQGPFRFHSYAKSIDANQLSQVRQQNPVIIDTRYPQDFRNDPVAGAINIPINSGVWKFDARTPTRLLDSPINELSQIDKTPVTTPIVVFGYANSYAAYNLLTILATQNRKNLYYIPQGTFTLKKVNVRTPDNYGVAQISSDDLRQKRNQFKYIIDVRGSTPFLATAIQGALNVEYKSRTEKPNENPYTGLGYEVQMQMNDTFKIEALPDIRKSSPIVLYGVNSYDFRPLKAAIFLKEQGYSQVKWYRQGYEEWLYLHKVYPEQYPIRLSSRKDTK